MEEMAIGLTLVCFLYVLIFIGLQNAKALKRLWDNSVQTLVKNYSRLQNKEDVNPQRLD